MEENHTPHSKLMLLVLAGILLLVSVVGFIISKSIQDKKTSAGFSQNLVSPTAAPTLIPYPKNGVFVLKPQEGMMKVGNPFSIDLIATSGKSSVAGYDVVLSYDKSVFDRQSIQNLSESFRIYTFDRAADRTSISATKNISVTQPISFTQTAILRFTFLPKKSGSYSFSLKAIGAESSKMVNEAAEVTYPDTSDISIAIK